MALDRFEPELEGAADVEVAADDGQALVLVGEGCGELSSNLGAGMAEEVFVLPAADADARRVPAVRLSLIDRAFAVTALCHLALRGWLASAADADALKASYLEFFEIGSLDDEPVFWAHAARKSTPYSETAPGQLAWLFQSRRIARNLKVTGHFSPASLKAALAELRALLGTLAGIARIPDVFSRAGIRFLIVEALPQTRIDGACFWLAADQPCVVLSMRYDRVDYLWHTLMHELGHVAAGDGWTNDSQPLDLDLVGQQATASEAKPAFEQEADRFAVGQLVPQDELQEFIWRHRPHYSRAKIIGFAQRLNVHAGIVVSQLQHRHEILYSHSRDLLEKVRDIITSVAPHDGWGQTQIA